MTLPHPRTGRHFGSPVPAGSGWPGDLATDGTAVALTAGAVSELAAAAVTLPGLDAQVSVCRACPRLVGWREEVATVKRRAYAAEPYWGRPVPGWGEPRPWLLVLGLAPAAHGANRTGRVFTGDRSGDWLFAALHRAGLVSSPASIDAADGLRANGIRVAAAVRCAPPGNTPTPEERLTCRPWLAAEWRLIAPDVRVVLALGGFAWRSALEMAGCVERPKPRFGHGVVAELGSGHQLIGCYHPSQQNTFTGRLTEQMLDSVLHEAKTRARIV